MYKVSSVFCVFVYLRYTIALSVRSTVCVFVCWRLHAHLLCLIFDHLYGMFVDGVITDAVLHISDEYL